MSSMHDERLSETLRLYRDALREERPSLQLDARIEAAITRHVPQRAHSPHSRWRLAAWSAAAASLAAIAAGVLALRPWSDATIEDVPRAPVSAPRSAATAPVVTAPVVNASATDDLPWYAADLSPWPVDAAIVRVRGSLATDAAHVRGSAPRLQYWVDVRLASDGSMRIVGIEPIYEDF